MLRISLAIKHCAVKNMSTVSPGGFILPQFVPHSPDSAMPNKQQLLHHRRITFEIFSNILVT